MQMKTPQPGDWAQGSRFGMGGNGEGEGWARPSVKRQPSRFPPLSSQELVDIHGHVAGSQFEEALTAGVHCSDPTEPTWRLQEVAVVLCSAANVQQPSMSLLMFFLECLLWLLSTGTSSPPYWVSI